MKFGLQIYSFTWPGGVEAIGPTLARAVRTADDVGFDSIWVMDHFWQIGPPDSELQPMLEGWTTLGFMTAHSQRARLGLMVGGVHYRNPGLWVKAATTLDVLSGGRLILGVAAGYLKREFQALGADFDARNDVADETIRAMKRAWTDEGIELIGRHFAATGNTQLPRPIQQPHPPLWVGGNSERAIRRAVELGDGWIPFPTIGIVPERVRTAQITSMAEFDRRLAYARAYAEEIGRTRHLDVTFVPFGLSMHAPESIDPSEFAENIDALGRRGVTWVTLNLQHARTRAEYCDNVAKFGDQLLRPLR
jgi:probable F420-dependent oxidoreductase